MFLSCHDKIIPVLNVGRVCADLLIPTLSEVPENLKATEATCLWGPDGMGKPIPEVAGKPRGRGWRSYVRRVSGKLPNR